MILTERPLSGRSEHARACGLTRLGRMTLWEPLFTSQSTSTNLSRQTSVLTTKFTGMYHPYGQVFFGMRLPLLLQRQKAEAAIRKIYSWRPQRIMLSHGRCFDADADKVIRRIFGEPPR